MSIAETSATTDDGASVGAEAPEAQNGETAIVRASLDEKGPGVYRVTEAGQVNPIPDPLVTLLEKIPDAFSSIAEGISSAYSAERRGYRISLYSRHALGAVVIVAAAALAWKGHIDGSAITALLSGAIGYLLGRGSTV